MPRPSKATLAKAKVMADAGLTSHHIGQSLGHDGKSIRKWLRLTDFNDPELKEMMEKIKADELDQLHLIGGKARAILNNYLDECLEGKREISNPIPVVAVMDRCFEQKRLLMGLSTQNISMFARVVEAACEDEDNEVKIAKSIEEAQKPEDKD